MWWRPVLLASIWGGLLALERRAFLQAMFSRPLVASVGAGLLLEDLTAGLFIGLVFELFHLGGAPLGGVLAEHETLPAVGATAMVAGISNTLAAPSTQAMWAVGILLCAPLGKWGRMLDSLLDARAQRYQARAFDFAEAGDFRRATQQNLRGMWLHLVAFGALCGGCSLIGYQLARVAPHVPLGVLRALSWAYPAMACVAAGIAVGGSHTRHVVRWAAFGAGLMLAMLASLAIARGDRPW